MVPAQHEAQKSDTGRVLLFPGRLSFPKRKSPRAGGDHTDHDAQAGAQVGDLRQYEQSKEPDDFRERMKINVIAFAFVVMLTMAGVWLADQLALLQKHSDCIFLGRKHCTDVETLPRPR